MTIVFMKIAFHLRMKDCFHENRKTRCVGQENGAANKGHQEPCYTCRSTPGWGFGEKQIKEYEVPSRYALVPLENASERRERTRASPIAALAPRGVAASLGAKMSAKEERRRRGVGFFFAAWWAAIAAWGFLISGGRTYPEEPFAGFIALTSGDDRFPLRDRVVFLFAMAIANPYRSSWGLGAPVHEHRVCLVFASWRLGIGSYRGGDVLGRHATVKSWFCCKSSQAEEEGCAFRRSLSLTVLTTGALAC
jgi:hypothetical protein